MIPAHRDRHLLEDRWVLGAAQAHQPAVEHPVEGPVVGLLGHLDPDPGHPGHAALDPGGGVVALDVDDLVAGRQVDPGCPADHDPGPVVLLAHQHEAGQLTQAGRDQGVEGHVEAGAVVDQLPQAGDAVLLGRRQHDGRARPEDPEPLATAERPPGSRRRTHRRTSCARPGSVGGMSTTAYRTLADQLRGWPVERLSRLLHLRPDLATPAPHDSGQLASRAATRSSVLRALDQLNRFELCVLDALVVVGQTSPDDLVDVVHGDEAEVHAALERLLDLALAWDSPQGVRPLTTVAEALTPGSPGISGLRPVSADPLSAEEAAAHLEAISPAARALLEHVLDSGGAATSGTARDRAARGGRPPRPRSCWRAACWSRAAAAPWCCPARSGSRCAADTRPPPPWTCRPTLATSERRQAMVDRAAAGAAFETAHRMELLLDQWGTRPPPPCAAAVSASVTCKRPRDRPAHRRAHRRPPGRGRPRPRGCCHRRRADGDARWIPTDAFDAWTARPTAERWLALAAAWLESPRLPGLVGSRDPAGKTRNALVPELTGVPRWRPACSPSACWGLEPDTVLASGTGIPSLRQHVEWLRPRRPRTRADQVVWAVRRAPRWASWRWAACRRTPRPCSPVTATARPPASPSCCPRPSTTCCSRPT